uniref:Cwf15/Cwc15 cell cycle control protein n=1 Tax=Palpitomonas bilix TaxID=652834 RepID=A0A7S3DG53_9EUKA|mmetsp:Transcript_35691/g.93028  ORF Transcript_35691/g.93028 Transcript_35691/m.93028 type:complete len:226 (+) Transcript_35691:62-739(+)
MTTAARPTWTPAKGQENTGYYKEFVPSKQYSSKDLPGHLELKVRQEGQSSEEELRLRDLKAELLEKENKHFDSRRKEDSRLLLTAGSKRAAPEIKPEELPKANREDRDEEFENDSDEDDSDEENEANELMKELQKIRQEREMEKEKQRMKEEAEKEAQTQNEVMSSNPLLNLGGEDKGFKMEKKWYDDVVFRNQAKGAPEKATKRFINDTIRSDFHRKFLDRYIK